MSLIEDLIKYADIYLIYASDKNLSDKHIKNLTIKKMIKNLKHHGHMMNLLDDQNFDDDLLFEEEI